MQPYSHDQTIVVTVFTRPDPDGRGQRKETRKVEIARFEQGQFEEAFCVLEAELSRLNGELPFAAPALIEKDKKERDKKEREPTP